MKKIRKPKFKVGQPVFWMNGVYRLFFVMEVNPLHCPDACFSYRLSGVHPRFRIFTTDNEWPYERDFVSEEVLRSVPEMLKSDRDRRELNG